MPRNAVRTCSATVPRSPPQQGKAQFDSGILSHMIIGFVDKCSNSLLRELDTCGIKYEALPPQFIVIVKCEEAVQIAWGPTPVVAPVIYVWLHKHHARKALLTMNDNKIEHLEGKTIEDLERLFASAKNMVIMEAQQPGSDSIWQHRKSLKPTTVGCFSYVAMPHDGKP